MSQKILFFLQGEFEELIMKLTIQKLTILSLFLLTHLWLISTTLEVKQDGTGDYLTIQSAINGSQNGDTVLVYPGTYYENINFNHKNITLCSLEATTQEEEYIETTIIDGSGLNSCIRIRYGEEVTIRGFTIQNGYGSQYFHDYPGGGIFAENDADVEVKNCSLRNNFASIGGGIYARMSNISLSGVSVYKNTATYGGGVAFAESTNVIFDEEVLCNIYNNNAASGADVYAKDLGINVEVFVDTFSVSEPDNYFAETYDNWSWNNTSINFSIQNHWMETVPYDLYVSTDGNDFNSGFSPDEPLKNISWAVRKIHADSLNPRTIFVENGEYSSAEFDFPFGARSNLSIIGETNNGVNLNNSTAPCITSILNTNNFYLSNLTLTDNNDINTYLFSINESHNIVLKNIAIINSFNNVHSGLSVNESSINIENLNLFNCIVNGSSLFYLNDTEADIKHLTIIDCLGMNPNTSMDIFRANGYPDLYVENLWIEGCASSISESPLIVITDDDGIGNKTLVNVNICNNISNSNRLIGLAGEGNNRLINATISDNTSNLQAVEINGNWSVENSIFKNNVDYEFYMTSLPLQEDPSSLTITNSLVYGGEESIYCPEGSAHDYYWMEGNLTEDPQLMGSGLNPYLLSENSPCIDAGSNSIYPELPLWDLLNNHRIWDGDGDGTHIVDMGCFEYGADPLVGNEPDVVPKVSGYNLVNYPNPFNPNTTISFELNTESAEDTKIEIYNIKGQLIKSLSVISTEAINGGVERSHSIAKSVIWNGTDYQNTPVSSGVYFATLKSGNKILASRKMLLLK